jgi:acyl-CoA reductase-like NAD-dependent aldehyde dehydrogenase
MFLIVFYLL